MAKGMARADNKHAATAFSIDRTAPPVPSLTAPWD